MRQSKRATDGEGGFFLTDVIVGLVILASVSGSLMAAFNLARQNSEQASRAMLALGAVKICLDDGSQRIGSTSMKIGDAQFETVRSVEVLKGAESDVVQLVRISCVAQWVQRGRMREVVLARVEPRAKAS